LFKTEHPPSLFLLYNDDKTIKNKIEFTSEDTGQQNSTTFKLAKLFTHVVNKVLDLIIDIPIKSYNLLTNN